MIEGSLDVKVIEIRCGFSHLLAISDGDECSFKDDINGSVKKLLFVNERLNYILCYVKINKIILGYNKTFVFYGADRTQIESWYFQTSILRDKCPYHLDVCNSNWKYCHWYGTLDFYLEDRLEIDVLSLDHVIVRIVWLDDDWHWSVVFNDIYII